MTHPAGFGPHVAVAALLLVAISIAPALATVRVNGSATVNPVVVEAASWKNAMEEKLATMQGELEELKSAFAEFRKQFE